MAGDGRSFNFAQVATGLMIIIFGGLLLAANLGYGHIGMVWRYWPLVLVIGGLARLLDPGCSGRTAPAIATLVGLWLLSDEFGWVHVHFWDWWPVLFVVAGGAIVMRAMRGRADSGQAPQGGAFAVWSGIRRRVANAAFQSTEVSAVMGGVEMDLRSATLPDGQATIDLFVLMGGVEIKVPPDWAVTNHVSAFMGSVEDNSTGAQTAKSRLVLRGFVMLGGVEIKT